MRRTLAIALSLAVSTSAIAQSAQAQSRPPGLRPGPTTPEAGLWSESDRAERIVQASGELNKDVALRDYIQKVACKVGAEYCAELRVYVLDRPYFNAAMAPNGYMEVWSGLLIRAADEDELAFVLGHEVGHYAENHSIERWNAAKGAATVAMIAGVAIGAIGYLGALAAIYGYNREQETEADRIGFQRMVAAGYDPAAGGRLWKALIAENAASDFPKVRRSDARFSIFNSHPLTRERVAALEALTAGKPAVKTESAKAYRAMIRPHLAAWLRSDLRRRDFGQTLKVIERLAVLGEDMGVLDYYRAETYRQRRAPGDTELSRDAYLRALTQADCPVDAWRELGDAYRRLGDKYAALKAFQTYLQKAPTADDVWMVEDAVKSLQGTAP